MLPLESNFLVPNATFLVELLVLIPLAAVFVVVTVVPFVKSIQRQQWGWVIWIFIFPFFGGLAWWLMGRRDAVTTS